MTEDSFSKISEESMAASTASAVRQRKKRKWDQPAEVLISAGGGVLPLSNMGTVVGITLPGGVAPLSSSLLTSSLMPAATSTAAMPQVFQSPFIQQNTAAVVQKLIQPKIQDELIAREIIINDAESTVRYKLTKRQTQEEIQRCTGAVVITRGKYRPPNVLTDTEKPLYLHISAGAHLKETAERIIAVDRAAAMVEEMLKQGVSSHPASTTTHSAVGNGGQFAQPLEACVFLGFDTDPSLNIAARIRGPNDQYINHIMNETGATVLLRGRDSGNFETPQREELQQSLHLYLSSNNPKSLEDAKLLAENLLDTISVECGVSRVTSSNKVYNAVPPPQQLLAGVQRSGNELNENAGPVGSASSTVGSTPPAQVSPATVPGVSSIYPQGTVGHGGLFSYSQPSTSMISYPQSSVSNGTSYSGYGGIYPQATPLQQVALALRQSPSPITAGTPPAASAGSPLPKPNLYAITESGKRLPHRRKFQELPVVAKGSAKPCQNSLQGSEFVKPGISSEDSVVRNVSTMPPPKKLVQSSSNGMPPPARTMPPPPPPKFNSPTPSSKANGENSKLTKSISEAVPDTLIKLMEYGEEDEDEDLEDNGLESPKIDSKPMAAPKPFWAL